MALLAVALTFVLAIVAARVSGETGIPPIGALGKVTQLTFGLIHPTSVGVNLMTANVTGGAAGQCSDLLHDLKTGKLLGASVRAQAWAQLLGVLVGSLAGSAAYLVLVPDPAGMLLTEEWPAPAVATWKAVAELFRDGIEAAPPGALVASIVGGIVGIALAVIYPLLPPTKKPWCPSPVSMGLAFVIPAWNSISLFIGALAAVVAARIGAAVDGAVCLADCRGFGRRRKPGRRGKRSRRRWSATVSNRWQKAVTVAASIDFAKILCARNVLRARRQVNMVRRGG